jgi:DNA-binding CsgD family transcriptional regulator
VTGLTNNGWGSRLGAELTIDSLLIRTDGLIKVACCLDPIPRGQQTSLWFTSSQSLKGLEIKATPEANAENSFETLTLREREVLEAITAGMNNPDIAAALNLSLDTVKTHVKSILQKLRARNRTHAVVCALMAGIVLMPAATAIATKIKATKAVSSQQTRWGLHLELRYYDP